MVHLIAILIFDFSKSELKVIVLWSSACLSETFDPLVITLFHVTIASYCIKCLFFFLKELFLAVLIKPF